MQPLLLVKQTLEVGFDPGPLLLDGPNVKFGSVAEMFWRGQSHDDVAHEFSVDFTDFDGERTVATFSNEAGALEVSGTTFVPPNHVKATTIELVARPPQTQRQLLEQVDPTFSRMMRAKTGPLSGGRIKVRRARCFLEAYVETPKGSARPFPLTATPPAILAVVATHLIHLPGLRDLPERLYPASHPGEVFPGAFQKWVAGLLATWVEDHAIELDQVNHDLLAMGLTWKVHAKRVGDTKVAVVVGRLPRPKRGGAQDVVSLADVGLGVSQALPIVMALRAAERLDIVYLEQPEIHLHPAAQVALAGVLGEAARRGVVVVCETHSHLLVRAVQNLVASGQIDQGLVGVNWFARDKDGVTRVTCAELDSDGAYGDLPINFGQVEMDLEDEYLNAIQKRW
jgi:hypothetical protein